MRFRTPWKPGDRKWFNLFPLPIERIKHADALRIVYVFYRPDGKEVSWFWRRRSAQRLADHLNAEVARAAKGE
jgi:hypothetical protein